MKRPTKSFKAIRRFTASPYTRLGVALILLASALIQAWGTIVSDLLKGDISAHHGIIVLALYQIMSVMPDMIDGLDGLLERLDKDIEGT